MLNYTEPTGAYGMIQVMALDYVFRLWAEILGKPGQRPALGRTQDVAATQSIICPKAPAPEACGC